jgi:hypothetical protein
MKLVSTLLGLLLAPAAAMVPNDPQRPPEAKTCRTALNRVMEAANGSPLVGQTENREHLLAALAQAERLCVPKKEKSQSR